MTALKSALARLDTSVGNLARAFRPPVVAASRRMVESFDAASLNGRLPQVADLEDLRLRLQAFFQHGDGPLPSSREWRQAPWILWNGEPRASVFQGLLPQLLERAQASPRLTNSLILAWLRDFVPNDPQLAASGQQLGRLLGLCPQSAVLDRWRNAQAEFGIFDAAGAPHRIATAVLTGEEDPSALFRRIGFNEALLALGGYRSAVLSQALALLPAALRGTQPEIALGRMLRWLWPDQGPGFAPQQLGEAVYGLLAAWLDGGPTPAIALRDQVLAALLSHLGDPRVQPGRWLQVGEPQQRLIRGWLARVSLEAFFNLISDHALDSHWRYRKAFWSSYLAQDAISDAWLVLGPSAHRDASSIRELRGSYGRLTAGITDPTHSVLLLQIGPLVICEWSHNGKLRAWPDAWANAPKLYRDSYSRRELIGKCLPFPASAITGRGGEQIGSGLTHFSSDMGYWQESAAHLIARRAGIDIGREKWMP